MPVKNGLGNKERAMLALAAEGLTNAEIAKKMGYARKTVDMMMWMVNDVLGTRNRTHAVVKALAMGYLKLDGLGGRDEH